MKNNNTMRKKIVVGNWKMNTNLEEAINLLVDINQFIEDEKSKILNSFFDKIYLKISQNKENFFNKIKNFI